MAKDYFAPEGSIRLFNRLKDIIGINNESKQKSLTVKHLEKAAIAGRLDEEIINS